MNRTIIVSICLGMMSLSALGRDYFVYFGTYTGAKSKGIYLSHFDSKTGRLFEPSLVAETKNPSFLALHSNGKILYAVGESASIGNAKQGAVVGFAINSDTGSLTPLNTQPSGGSGPCHLTVDAKGRYLFTANYGSGSVAALGVNQDGSLEAPAVTIQHAGSSVNAQRQSGPHAHCVNLDPDQRYLLACDLGLDKIMVYRVGEPGQPLVPSEPPFALTAPGVGPRHLAFSKNGKFVYGANEMGSSVTVYQYDAKRGTLKETQTTSTLPEKFSGENSDAEIAMHPSGKFVYASNRGHDSIAVFKVHGSTGELSLVEHVPTLGKVPRHFALDPSGEWLLAENQASDTVAVFHVNTKTGRLKPNGPLVNVGSPVCAVFLPAK